MTNSMVRLACYSIPTCSIIPVDIDNISWILFQNSWTWFSVVVRIAQTHSYLYTIEACMDKCTCMCDPNHQVHEMSNTCSKPSRFSCSVSHFAQGALMKAKGSTQRFGELIIPTCKTIRNAQVEHCLHNVIAQSLTVVPMYIISGFEQGF